MKLLKISLITLIGFLFLFIKPSGFAAETTTTSTPSVTNSFFGVTGDVCTFWKALFDFAIQIAGGIALIVVAIGGILYLASVGSADKQKTAKDLMYGAGFGMVLALTSWLLFTVLNPYLLECKIVVKQAKLYYSSNNSCDGYETYDTEEACEQATTCKTGYRNRGCVLNSQRTKNTQVEKISKEEQEKWCCASECGKNLVHLMESWRGTCFGPCHCAFFVSTILFESGCPDNILTTSANGVFAKLKTEEYKKMGWECFEGKDGIQAGDVVHKPSHIEIAVSSTKTMGSNTGYWDSSKGINYMSSCADDPACIPDNKLLLASENPNACENCSPDKSRMYAFGAEEGPGTGRFAGCTNNQCVNDTGGISKVYEYCRPPW